MLGSRSLDRLCCISIIWLYVHILPFSYADLPKYDKSVVEDGKLDTPNLIKKYGYPAEIHRIETKDGFIVTAHRIPKPGGQPVLLVHGILDSSASWILLGPSTSLGYLLSQQGYDVWLLNTRGNRYSRSHKRYHRYQPQFWDFSFHEVGIYDLPATIDYILARSKGFEQIHYVGHSQGTTSFWVMGSERPSFMKKIKLMQALSPVAYFDYAEGPIAEFLSKYVRPLTMLHKLFGIHEFPPESESWIGPFSNLCSYLVTNICATFSLQNFGIDFEQLNINLAPLITGHAPSATSVKSLLHFAQQVHSGGFFKFDYYNPQENRLHYGSAGVKRPPQYKLGNVDCKVALYYGQNDRLAAVKDVERLIEKLPNVVYSQKLPYKKFNHIDFVWGKDVKSMLNENVIMIMQKIDRGQL